MSAPAALRLDEAAPLATQLLAADGREARARLLLRLPDAIILACQSDLEAACREVAFDLGLRYLGSRVAALHATRDRCGALPHAETARLEMWTGAMLACAGNAP